jgi:hypothetical protein
MPASQVDTALTNGHDGHAHPPAVASKKSKGKKAMDSNEASRLLQARISQLEQDAAGEKDQELEIGAWFSSSARTQFSRCTGWLPSLLD